MLFSEAKGRKVVSTTTAETVGSIDAFIVEPENGTVAGMTIKKSAGGDTLRWSDLTAFGEDAVTVAGSEQLTDADGRIAELSDKHRHVLGKRLLSSSGDELGKVADVEFDPATGVITALLHDDGSIAGTALLGVGSYAVVVADPAA